MTEDTATIHDLIRRLLEAFIDHPQALTIEAKELPGRVDWKIKVHADDYGKVAGRQGSHIQALQALVRMMGTVVSEDYRLQLLEPDPGPRRGRSPDKKATEYDPADALLLLQDILCEILVECPAISVEADETPERHLVFTFKIDPVTHQDRDMLSDVSGFAEGESLLLFLQTMFRAYANRDGVIFNLKADV